MRNLTVLNETMYFDEAGRKVMPTREEIRKIYKLDDKMVAVKAEFPAEGWRIRNGRMTGFEKFNTREDAEREVENRINEQVNYYISLVK